MMDNNENTVEVAAEGRRRGYWREVWQYHELLLFLAWRDLKVRYKQTAIGVAWVILRPLITMVILTFVFQRVAGLGKNLDVPYQMLVIAGLLPWHFFSTVFAESANSLVANSQMISKVYFPRVLIPLSSSLAGAVDFMVTVLILVPFMIWFGVFPGLEILLFPLFLLLLILFTLSIGIGFAALNVRFRDVRFIVPFIVQIGLYVSPVGFSVYEIPEQWRALYSLNPMVGIVEGFRWSLFGDSYPVPTFAAAVSVACTALIMFASLHFFRKVERTFADEI